MAVSGKAKAKGSKAVDARQEIERLEKQRALLRVEMARLEGELTREVEKWQLEPPKVIEECMIHVAWSGLHDRGDDGRGHLVQRGKVTADLGLDHVPDPPFTNEEMQEITRAAKFEALKCLRRRPKVKAVKRKPVAPSGEPRYVLVQEWEESEAGWGVRPDGYTMHATKAAMDRYVAAYWARMPPRDAKGRPPDCYSRESGKPYMVRVAEEIYQRVLAAGDGCWGKGNSPPAEWERQT
jgi:hypothetical protein